MRARPVRPLPAGPFPVPISTIDWLVSRECPAARYVTLRDLTRHAARDLELRKARSAVSRDVFFRDVLPMLRTALSPDRTPEELLRRFTGGLWLTSVLVELGGDLEIPEVRHAGDVLLARWEKTFIAISRDEAPEVDRRVLGLVVRTLAGMGHGADPRVLLAADHLARCRVAGGGPAEPALAKDLLVFAAVPAGKRSEALRRAIDFCVERAVAVDLRPSSELSTEPLTFPTGDGTDLAELLFALSRVEAPAGPVLLSALARLASRADHRARWTLEAAPAGRLPVTLERDGELSRWLTVRSLCALAQFVGLKIV